jgi:ubiquinone/menaquinone biosynthesis C-methylase UbiE
MNPLHLTEPIKVKTAATYNSAADHFDDTPLGFWDVTGRRTIERLGPLPGWLVLDVGCGTGASALPAAEAVGPTGSVIGVDLAENLLNRARAKAHERGLHNVEFRQADMTALGFPDGHFDAVVSVFSIFFVPDMEAQVRELWRMVKPGGRLVITTWDAHIFQPIYTAWREAVRAQRPDLYSAYNPWDRISTPEQLDRLLRDGGVPKADIAHIPASQALQTPEDWWTLVIGSGLRAAVDAMDAPTAARLHDTIVGWVQENHATSIQTNAIYAVATKGVG